MGQEIVTPEQKKIINIFTHKPEMDSFYLTGGTALAGYYLYHRISDDLDFFIFDEPDRMFLHEFANDLQKALKAKSVRYERLYGRSQFFFTLDNQELKVEFAKYHFQQLEKPNVVNGLRVDTLRDISANKMMAMLDRFDPKDFIDLYFILQQFSLENIRKDAEKKFEIKIGDLFLGGELVKVRRIQALPKMIKPLTMEELKIFFAAEAKKLAPEILK